MTQSGFSTSTVGAPLGDRWTRTMITSPVGSAIVPSAQSSSPSAGLTRSRLHPGSRISIPRTRRKHHAAGSAAQPWQSDFTRRNRQGQYTNDSKSNLLHFAKILTGPIIPDSASGASALGPAIVQVWRSASGRPASKTRRLYQVEVTSTRTVFSPSSSADVTSHRYGSHQRSATFRPFTITRAQCATRPRSSSTRSAPSGHRTRVS